MAPFSIIYQRLDCGSWGTSSFTPIVCLFFHICWEEKDDSGKSPKFVSSKSHSNVDSPEKCTWIFSYKFPAQNGDCVCPSW